MTIWDFKEWTDKNGGVAPEGMGYWSQGPSYKLSGRCHEFQDKQVKMEQKTIYLSVEPLLLLKAAASFFTTR